MFIKRAKSRPSLRARESESDDPVAAPSPLGKSSITAGQTESDSTAADEVPEEEEETGLGSVMERKKAQKSGRDKRLAGVKSSGGTRLSFGGSAEDANGGGVGGGKSKSSLRQSINLPTTPIASGSTSTSDYSNGAGSSSRGAGTYSKEYLSELKAATPSRAGRAEANDDDEMEGGVGGSSSSAGGLSRLAREKYASQFAEDTTAGIPDAARVAAAKMKRQALLESSKHGDELGEDYIALGGGKVIVRDDEEKGPHPESRLMREEDEGDEGDEDLAAYTESSNRLYIGKQAKKDEARRLRGEIGDMIAEREADDEESDEETREWERAQASRAGGTYEEIAEKAPKQSHVSAPIPRSRPIPTLAPAQARVLAALSDLKLTRETGEHDLEVVSEELVALEEQEKEVRREVERVEAKREWVEEFRGWVETLGAFLEEKFPLLHQIEKDSLAHLQERADMVDKRRSEDDADDLALFLGIPASSASANGTEEEEVEEVDELGRTIRRENEAGPSSAVRRARRSERDSRRTKRKARPHSSSAPGPGPSGDDDGFSTDSELGEGDARDYASAQRDLERRVEALLEDVKAEDFRDPAKGLAVRFGDWREKYEEEYVGAFGGLSLVQAWSFWARGEMAGWEPLRSDSAIEQFTWFQALHAYSHPRKPRTNGAGAAAGEGHADMDLDDDEDDDEPPLGPDGDLNTQMVNDALVPLLTSAFQNGAYDVYSAKQTRKAVDLVEVVQLLAGKESRKFTDLLRALLSVFTEHISTLSTTISLCLSTNATPPPSFDPASRVAVQRFVRRRIKLLRNILLWRRHAPEQVRGLIGKVVEDVVLPVLMRSWEGGGREMAGQILMASGGLLGSGLVGMLQRGPTR